MPKPEPDPERLADAQRRAAFSAEHAPGQRSNSDAHLILATDVLSEFVDDIYTGPLDQVAWALQWAEDHTADLAPHHLKLTEWAWQKIQDDADRAQWERLGLRRGNA